MTVEEDREVRGSKDEMAEDVDSRRSMEASAWSSHGAGALEARNTLGSVLLEGASTVEKSISWTIQISD